MGTRESIVGAAERVIRSRGLARATTREIARASGYSEGTIYKHFESKEELFIAVLTERLSPFVGIIRDLPQRAGGETLEDVLVDVARAALAFYSESFPMSASIFSEPDLLVRHREEIHRLGMGPEKANEAVAAYLDAERNLGRVRKDVDPEAAAALLLGACFQRAFLKVYAGEDGVPAQEEDMVRRIVAIVMRGM